MRRFAICIIIVIPLILISGFLIGIAEMNDWGGTMTTSQKTLFAPFASGHRKKLEKQAIEYKRLMALLENNPELAIIERWERKSPLHVHVFLHSFENANVRYNPQTLERIYESDLYEFDYNIKNFKYLVFRNSGCSKEFLARHFDNAYQSALQGGSYSELGAIIANPNTPQELVEKVASDQVFHGSMAIHAQRELARRRLEQATEPADK